MAVDFKDYYRILGVDRKADDKTIKSAYRRLARKHHPDVAKTKDATERFKEISEAYEVLSDPEKRRRYDSLGPDWKGYSQAPPGGRDGGVRVQYGDDLGNVGDFSEVFRTILGDLGAQARRGPRGGGSARRPLPERHGGATPVPRAQGRRRASAPADHCARGRAGDHARSADLARQSVDEGTARHVERTHIQTSGLRDAASQGLRRGRSAGGGEDRHAERCGACGTRAVREARGAPPRQPSGVPGVAVGLEQGEDGRCASEQNDYGSAVEASLTEGRSSA